MDDAPVSAVTLQVLNGLIDTQMKLRDASEKRWLFAREALFNLARLVATDWLEERQQQKGGLDVVRIEELSRLVFERVAALHAAHIHSDAQQMQKALARIDELHKEVKKFTLLSSGFKRELDEANLEITRLRTQADTKKIKPASTENNASAPNAASVLQVSSVQIPEPAIPETQPNPAAPIWFREWISGAGFERQSFIIRLIGDTGIALRPEIVKLFTEKFSTGENSGAFNYVAVRLSEMGLISAADTEGGLKGRPAKTISLTNLGESAYLLLSGKQPVKSDFDDIRPAHSTDAHAILILKACSMLEANGYGIISKSKITLKLPDGRITSPDILAVSQTNRKEIHIEVERDTGKGDLDARERKWQNAFDAGPDCLYVVCENISLQKRLAQEIFRALASEERLQRADIYMTNLDVLKTGQRHPDGSIWVSQKHKKK